LVYQIIMLPLSWVNIKVQIYMKWLLIVFCSLILGSLIISICFAGQGCCSYHGGQQYCDCSTGRWVCNDDTYSPTCRCSCPKPRPVWTPPPTPIPTPTPSIIIPSPSPSIIQLSPSVAGTSASFDWWGWVGDWWWALLIIGYIIFLIINWLINL